MAGIDFNNIKYIASVAFPKKAVPILLNKNYWGKDIVSFDKKKNFMLLGDAEKMKLITDSIKENLVLGKGKCTVYHIKNTDCAIKIPKGVKEIPNSRITKDITVEDEVNHVVGKIGNEIIVMKLIEGTSVKGLHGFELNRFVGELKESSLKNYILQLFNAIKLNMSHDIGGANTIINKDKGIITAIDFYKSQAKKMNPFSDVYFQLGMFLDEPIEQNRLLGKTAGAFLKLLKTNQITSIGTNKVDVNLNRVSEAFMLKDKDFIAELQKRLNKIVQLKSMQNISKEINEEFLKEVESCENFISSVIK